MSKSELLASNVANDTNRCQRFRSIRAIRCKFDVDLVWTDGRWTVRPSRYMLCASRETRREGSLMDDMTAPAAPRYFEDYVAGSSQEFGDILVEEAEILSFARRFDLQTFHTDPEAAKESIYGGLIASGWHTASLMMRLVVDH